METDINTSTKPAVANLMDDLPMDTSDLHVVKPGTNKRTGWVVTFAGPGHPKTIALNTETLRKQLDEAKRIKQSQANSRKVKLDDEQPEDSRREFIEGLVARIVTWSPVDFGEGPIEFSDKAAVALLLDPKKGAYVSQFVDFLIDDRAFMKGSATT
jgi:hypothetical protein